MKREILFRGKRVDNGEFVYGYLFPVVINEAERWFIIPCDTFCPKSITIGELQVEVILETVGQFTGLTDKNGFNIFEGDKLTDGIIVYVVEYNTQNTSFYINPIERLKTKKHDFLDFIKYGRLGNGYYSRKDLEIIGNIHEK